MRRHRASFKTFMIAMRISYQINVLSDDKINAQPDEVSNQDNDYLADRQNHAARCRMPVAPNCPEKQNGKENRQKRIDAAASPMPSSISRLVSANERRASRSKGPSARLSFRLGVAAMRTCRARLKTLVIATGASCQFALRS